MKLIYGQTSTLISIKLIYAINHITYALILNNIYYKTKYINFMQYLNIENWVFIINIKMGLNIFNKKYTIHA